MHTIGKLMIIGILLWIFIITLPFLWWLWVLILGVVIVYISPSKKEKREKLAKEKEFEDRVKNFGKEENIDIKNL